MLLEIVDYQENEKDIIHWVNLKGKYRYITIINFLKSKNITCIWKNVTNYMKYDKRILITAFKYIVFLEELFKSFISEYKDIKQSALLRYGFKSSLEEYLHLGNNAEYENIDLNLLANEKETIIEFRNSVAHNKILLNRTFNNKNLKEVLNIFVNILPNSYRNGFIKDINNCSKGIIDKLWHIELYDIK